MKIFTDVVHRKIKLKHSGNGEHRII
uniref:Uncharacterized protein n=1 Tax=Anguilla anguilla TaxID=7936 RepID=A0A0E9PUB7_ANGAN